MKILALPADERPPLPAAATLAQVVAFYEPEVPPRFLRRPAPPAGAARAPPPPAQQLQHALYTALNSVTCAEIRAEAADARRLDAALGVGGTAFLTATPSSPITTFTDDQFRFAVRLRLGVMLFDDLPQRCPHCAARPLLSAATTHPVACAAVMHDRGLASMRHDGLHDIFVRFLQAAGMTVRVEARPLRYNDDGDEHRPDLVVLDAEHSLFVTDHTVIDPCSPSRSQRSVTQSVKYAEQGKRRAHAANAAADGATFVPLVFSVLGRWSEATVRFVRLLTAVPSDAQLSRYPGGRVALVNDFVSALSCSIQKGNHNVALHFYNSTVPADARARSRAASAGIALRSSPRLARSVPAAASP